MGSRMVTGTEMSAFHSGFYCRLFLGERRRRGPARAADVAFSAADDVTHYDAQQHQAGV